MWLFQMAFHFHAERSVQTFWCNILSHVESFITEKLQNVTFIVYYILYRWFIRRWKRMQSKEVEDWSRCKKELVCSNTNLITHHFNLNQIKPTQNEKKTQTNADTFKNVNPNVMTSRNV